MENLMDVMVDKCRTECNDILRSLISQYNARAGLYLIHQNPTYAIHNYISVLDLIKDFKDIKLKVDPCQVKFNFLHIIHYLFNLFVFIREYMLCIICHLFLNMIVIMLQFYFMM